MPTPGDLAAAEKPLPAVLQAASRGAGGGPDPLFANIVVEESYTLAAVGRGEAPDTRTIEDGRKLLALEAADGTTIFMRSDRLNLVAGLGSASRSGHAALARGPRPHVSSDGAGVVAGWGSPRRRTVS